VHSHGKRQAAEAAIRSNESAGDTGSAKKYFLYHCKNRLVNWLSGFRCLTFACECTFTVISSSIESQLSTVEY